jgi:hypothetical protein
MAYAISGTVLSSCPCHDICPCNVDSKPNSAEGDCRAFLVFGIKQGEADGVDLSGVNVAFFAQFPNNPTAGNWKVGLVIDEGASDEQAAATERVFKGEDGGPWAEFAGLREEWLGVERAGVSLSDGNTPSAEVAGMASMSFEPYTDAEGNPTRLKDAVFGLAPEFTVGKASGKSDAFGISMTPDYGETGEFEFAS